MTDSHNVACSHLPDCMATIPPYVPASSVFPCWSVLPAVVHQPPVSRYLCCHGFHLSFLTLMVVTCSASAISRSVSVAKFAAVVVMNALISSGCTFAYPSPRGGPIVLIATFKAVLCHARYFAVSGFFGDLLNFPEVCIFDLPPSFKSFSCASPCLPYLNRILIPSN